MSDQIKAATEAGKVVRDTPGSILAMCFAFVLGCGLLYIVHVYLERQVAASEESAQAASRAAAAMEQVAAQDRQFARDFIEALRTAK